LMRLRRQCFLGWVGAGSCPWKLIFNYDLFDFYDYYEVLTLEYCSHSNHKNQTNHSSDNQAFSASNDVSILVLISIFKSSKFASKLASKLASETGFSGASALPKTAFLSSDLPI
jgi:hypothetical protein